MNEDPGIVFSVKELIGRLDGKLDMMMTVLTNKADRSDVSALDRRIAKVEDEISILNTAAKATQEARRENTDTHRWRVTATISLIAALLVLAGLIVSIVVK